MWQRLSHFVEQLKRLKKFKNIFNHTKEGFKMSGAFDMGEAVRPSALIRTARWSLLLVGIWYGARR